MEKLKEYIAFIETVIEQIGDTVIQSTVKPATRKDIKLAKNLYKKGKCPHNIIVDEKGYMYDFRSCFTCGKGLGVI